MREKKWADVIAHKIHNHLQAKNKNLAADSAQKLIYKNEITEYTNQVPTYNTMSYETDILIYEWLSEERWKPRVVIEVKITSVTTHDAITYSKKSKDHKTIHPYLRYGIFIGNLGESRIPGRLIRHGENFDFMISWQDFDPSKKEWESFMRIILAEVVASQKLDTMLFDTRSKSREKISILHRPLVTELT